MKKLVFCLFSICTTLAFAQETSKERIIDVISTLASDEMKGREIGTPENDNAAKYIASIFEENKLEYCTGDSYLIPFTFRDKTVYNICGIKKGNSEKYLGFSGHFDHIGISRNTGNDNIYNGADDNASGVMTLIGISDYFKTKDPAFSMVFMAFNGEEKGMLGSRAISEDKNLEPIYKNLTALFNFEMLGTEAEFGKNTVYITGDEFSNLDELFNKHAVNKLKIHPDPYPTQRLFYRSDNVSFVRKKIIAHSISTVNMGKVKHYHQANDDIKIIDADNMVHIINNFAKTIEKLTPQNFNPQYNEKVKFD